MERLRSGDPEQIGPWQIVNRLGSGGMGIVYMGTNGTHAAAIKVVREFLLEDPASRTRLEREVDTLLRVKSEFVAEIVGSDINGNPAWIATNYVDGPSLKILIEKEGPLPEDQWIDFARGFLSALVSVHSVGVVHRDIKPSNILITKSGPKLIDFGISFVNDATSLTGTGMVAGTPAWLAPEQFLGKEITTSVDNFAAGSTLMFAATGKTPWGADDSSVGAVMHTILMAEPDTSTLTDFQIDIITPLLVKDAQLRKTAAQMLKKLNDGPRKLSLGSKKEQKQQEAASQNSFLEKTSKQDIEDKKAKQDALNKQIEDEKAAQEKSVAEAAKKLAKDQDLAKRAEEKLQKKTAEESAKQAKRDLRSAAKASSGPKTGTGSLGSGKKQLPILIVAGLVALSIAAYFVFAGSKSSEGQVAGGVENPPAYTWSALISGETEATTGDGTTFEFYVCDQYVLGSSLKVESISPRPADAGPLKAKVFKGDARCGAEFDTIVVSGREAKQPGSINYFVAGKTTTSLDLRYDFSVTVSSN
jgi:serine/threonine protein kinase